MFNFKKNAGMAALLSLLLCAAMALSSCGGEESGNETEASTQGATEPITVGESEEVTEAPVEVSCIFTVKDQDGLTVSDVTLELQQNGVTVFSTTTDGEGKATCKINTGSYVVKFTTVPEGYSGDDVTIDIAEDTAAMELAIRNVTPNGEADRPFIIVEDTTEVELPAGGTYHYMLYSGMNRIITVENANVTIRYKDTDYAPDENGKIEVPLQSEGPRDPVSFSLSNTTDAAMTVTVKIESVLGSIDNPIEIPSLDTTLTVNVPKEGTVYHKWTATGTGILMVYSDTDVNNITLTNTVTSAVSYFTDGTPCEYITVSEGDEIIVNIAATVRDSAVDVSFRLSFYAGNAETPVPVAKDKVAFNYRAGASYTFTYTAPADAGKKALVIEGVNAQLVLGSQTYTPDENGKIQVTLTESAEQTVTFTLTNSGESAGEIVMEVKDAEA